ncbi:hypothetical protein BRADI_2g02235v3 [Brachypodium distachyon]|uniref:Uncharacterized protein n=1 Tax=Brachypodium distachyon TaxID=15368 RepID=A0A2K2D6I6_BRADI|nr:hypothetical protein BRADI_2g02235v3 [Brachypodium distachyon]
MLIICLRFSLGGVLIYVDVSWSLSCKLRSSTPLNGSARKELFLFCSVLCHCKIVQLCALKLWLVCMTMTLYHWIFFPVRFSFLGY